MENLTLNLKDLIGLTADVMAIFGLGGLFTWSFIKKEIETQSFTDSGIEIFAMSVKCVISFFLLGLLFIPAYSLHFWLVLIFSSSYGPGDGLWNSEKVFPYVSAYVLSALLWIPIAILTISSLFTWSLRPFRRFWFAFTRRTHS